MFPFLMSPMMTSGCCGSSTQQSHRRRQLEFLKWMRDSLETRLSAVNAAIATMERQMGDESPSNPTT
jgi:hypothetical protein